MSHSLHMPRLPLQDLALAPASRLAYERSLSGFLRFASLRPAELLTIQSGRLDRLLALYIQHSYDTSGHFTYASHALAAVVFHRPDVRLCLYISRQCLRGWSRVKQGVSHPPITWELTVAMACTFARAGHHAPAVAILVAFDCYLRVGELTRLRWRDIIMPDDARMGSAHTTMAVCLAKTKTGINQSVSVQRPDVALVLARWVRSMGGASAVTVTIAAADSDTRSLELVFPFTPVHLRRLMHWACGEMGISDIHYVPHSFRHGGATADFMLTGSVERVQFRGRWKSLESLRTYVQTARAVLAAQRVPDALHQWGLLLSTHLAPVMQDLLCSTTAGQVRPSRRRRRSVTFCL